MKRIAVISFVVVVVLMGVLLIAPGFMDWSKYRTLIVTQLHKATGHEYRIGGDLEFAIVPSPRLLIEELDVSTPLAGGGSRKLLSLKRVDISMALWPLLHKVIEVNRIRLVQPVIHLAIDKDGTSSWMTPLLQKKMESRDAKRADSALLEAVSLDEIEIDQGVFEYTDERSGTKIKLDHIELVVQAESLWGPFVVDGGFAYLGRQIEVKAKTGRLAGGTASIALQTEFNIPSSGSTMTFSGVLDFAGSPEYQGETTLKTTDMSGFMSLLGKAGPDFLKKPLSVQGVLTASVNDIAYRNLKINFADIEGTGSFSLKNIKGTRPLEIEINLNSLSTLDMDSLFGEQKSRKSGGLFFPESLTWKRDVQGSANLKFAGMVFHGGEFSDVSVQAKKTGRNISFGIKAGLAEGGELDSNTTLYFGAASMSETDGSVTFSEPVMNIELSAKTDKAGTLYNMVADPASLGSMQHILSNKLDISGKIEITPVQIGFSEIILGLGKDLFSAEGSYARRSEGKRDLLTLAVGADSFNADQWFGLQKEKKKSSSKKPFEETLQNLVMPFDTELTVSLGKVRLYGHDYAKAHLNARTENKKLTLKSAGLEDQAGNSLVLSGSIQDFAGLHGIDVVLAGKSKNTDSLLQSYAIDNSKFPKIGKSEILSEFRGHADNLAFTVNMKALRGTLEASGILTDMLQEAKMSGLTFRLKHPNYVQLVNFFNPDFKSAVGIDKDLDFFASMKREEDTYSFSEIKANIGPLSLTGAVSADLSKSRPYFSGQLQMGDVALDHLTGRKKRTKGMARANRSRNRNDVRWSRDAVNTAWMHMVDFDFRMVATSLQYGNWKLGNVALDVKLKNGVLTVEKMDGGLYGGRLVMAGKIASTPDPGQSLSIAGKAEFRNVELESFVKSFSGSSLLKARGAVSGHIDVEASGLSPAALIFDLHGKGGADAVNLIFDGFDLAHFSRTLTQPSSSMTENLTSLLNATMSGGRTKFDTMNASYTIKDGIIVFDNLKLAGPDANVVGVGNINLPLWSLDLETEIKLKEPEDAPPLRAVFKGPLDNPAHTFGKSAMDSWFQSQFGNLLEQTIIDKLQKSGIFRIAPDAPTQEQTPQQTQQKQPSEEIKPEELFFNILQGVLGQ